MAYNENLADRVREALADLPDVEEKKMFRGVTFMVNDKMCVSVSGDELMLRLDPDITEQLAEENGTRPMVHGGKYMKGFIYQRGTFPHKKRLRPLDQPGPGFQSEGKGIKEIKRGCHAEFVEARGQGLCALSFDRLRMTTLVL
jgi:ribosomal protein S6E (S10)